MGDNTNYLGILTYVFTETDIGSYGSLEDAADAVALEIADTRATEREVAKSAGQSWAEYYDIEGEATQAGGYVHVSYFDEYDEPVDFDHVEVIIDQDGTRI